MPHRALTHFNNQVGGQGPGGPGHPNEAFILNKSSNALCRGTVGQQGRSWDHPANCITGQEAGRGQKELEGALFRDQGTSSEPELMDFWAVICRGSRSNWDLLWLGQHQALCFYQKSFTGSKTEQNYQLRMFFKVRGWRGSGITFVLVLVNNFISNWPLEQTDT